MCLFSVKMHLKSSFRDKNQNIEKCMCLCFRICVVFSEFLQTQSLSWPTQSFFPLFLHRTNKEICRRHSNWEKTRVCHAANRHLHHKRPLGMFWFVFLNVPNEQKKYLKKEISNNKFGAIRKVRLSSISCFDCCCCRVRVCCSVCMCVSVRHLNRRVLCLGDVVGNMVG